MNSIHISPLSRSLTIDVSLPGSLSYTIRALTIGAMIKGEIMIINPAKCDDTTTMIEILKTLGIAIEEGKNYIKVLGSIADIKQKEYILNAHISGRTARTVLAFLCVIPGTKTLICDEGFKKRPVKDLVYALKSMGADIIYQKTEGYLPVRISSSKLKKNAVTVNGQMSSQYISALLMIAPIIGGIQISVVGKQSSKPFIDMTMQIMMMFGVSVLHTDYTRYTVSKELKYTNINTYIVEADAIAASYFWGIAALTKSTIKILQLPPQSLQGDVQFADVLSQMGCIVEKNISEKWISITGTNRLDAVIINMNHIPDTVPTLAVIAAFANGTTVMTGLSHLKIKESDRIESPKDGLQKMGIVAQMTDDSLSVTGGNPKSAHITTYGDHRIAMAFAIAGLALPQGMYIDTPEVVDKSFPRFWETLRSLGTTVTEETE